MERLFIIGASILQLPAIKKAKEMGLYVGVADYNQDAIGIPYADEYYNVSTIDEEGIYEAAKTFKADGIMTLATDMPMRSLAYASNKLNLTGITYDTAVRATDKLEMIKCFKKFGVSHPWFYTVKNEKEIESIISEISFPCITKPTDSSGSRGVMVAYNEEELKNAITYSLKNSRKGNVIIEEMMVGQEVSVEVIVYKNQVHVLQITDKLTTGEPHFVEMGHSQPSILNNEMQNKIKELSEKAVKAIGIENGPAHIEIMVTEDGPKMIELGARMGGDCITTHLVPLSTGIDMVRAVIDISLGKIPQLEKKFEKSAVIRFITGKEGIINQISGIEKAKEVKNVKNVEFMKKPGDLLEGVKSSLDRVGYIISQDDELKSAIHSVESALGMINVDVRRKEKVMFLGGFPQMVNIVETAKKMGIYTVVVDMDPESPAKKIADCAYDLSTNEIDELVKICVQNEITGVFNGFEDFNIHNAEKLCERCNLPFYSNKKVIDTVTNKKLFKELCKKKDIAVIEQYDLEQAIEKMEYPYIIKPVDSYGSRGITVCYCEDELRLGYSKAIEASLTNECIVERYIDSDCGTELFYTIVNGNIHLTATADRFTIKISDNDVPLPVAEVFPSQYEKKIKDVLDQKIRSVIKELNVENGLILIQTLNEKHNFYPYEMALRFTGEQHYQLVKEQQGIDLAEMMLEFCIGKDISRYDSILLECEKFTKPSINLSIILTPGKIKTIKGLNKLDKIKEVKSYILVHREGDIISNKGDYSRILIRINMVADTKRELNIKIQEILDNISVLSEDKQEMILTEFSISEGEII